MLNAFVSLFFSGSRRCSTSNKIKSRLTIPFYLQQGFFRWSKQVEKVLYVFQQVRGSMQKSFRAYWQFSLVAHSHTALSWRHSLLFPLRCRKSKVTVHSGIRTKVTHVEGFPNNAKGCGCPFPTNLSGKGAVNSLYWKCQLNKMKCHLEKPHCPLNTSAAREKVPSTPSAQFPTKLLGTL